MSGWTVFCKIDCSQKFQESGGIVAFNMDFHSFVARDIPLFDWCSWFICSHSIANNIWSIFTFVQYVRWIMCFLCTTWIVFSFLSFNNLINIFSKLFLLLITEGFWNWWLFERSLARSQKWHPLQHEIADWIDLSAQLFKARKQSWTIFELNRFAVNL